MILYNISHSSENTGSSVETFPLRPTGLIIEIYMS